MGQALLAVDVLAQVEQMVGVHACSYMHTSMITEWQALLTVNIVHSSNMHFQGGLTRSDGCLLRKQVPHLAHLLLLA
jgi:hypothetical protein